MFPDLGTDVNTSLILILVAKLLGIEANYVQPPEIPSEGSSVPGAVRSRIVNPEPPEPSGGFLETRE